MKFGLKLKILLGIVSLLAICTAFSLGYSYKLFIEDKTSYIFESGLKKAENITDQINFKLADINNQGEINLALMSSPAINFEKLLSAQEEMISTGIIEINKSNPTIQKQFLNSKLMNKLSTAHGLKSQSLFNEILDRAKSMSKNGGAYSWISSKTPAMTILFQISKISSGTKYLFTIHDLSPLLESFYKDNIYQNKIISINNPNERKNYEDIISKIDYKTGKKGVFEATTNQKEVLVSYSFANDKLLALSIINKKDAFGITNFLILKTVLFAIFLIGIAIIAGIYFSSSITFPIMRLTNVAQRVSKGDFSETVNIKTNDEIKILGDTFNQMSFEIQDLLKNKEELIAQLEDYNKNLERMVEQRTLELKEANDFMALMVNSLDQGLLVFDSQLKLHPMHTRACELIFEKSPLGETVVDILGITDQEKIQSLEQWAMVTFNEMIPFESAINLGPREKITGTSYSDPNYKHIKIDYYPMRDAEEKISNIVMIATDKTSEVRATENAKEKEAYVSMILKILNNKNQFESFINEVEEIFDQFHRAYSIEEKKIEFDLCMMLFHTLNGGFGIYSLTKLQIMAREYETEISNIKDSDPDPLEYIPFLQIHIESLKEEFHNFRVELDSLIGTKFSSNQIFTDIPRSKILELKSLVAETQNKELITYYADNFVKTPIINYFKAYEDLCKTTAVKINKEFKGLTFHNPDLKVEAEPLMEFFNVLVHLFRNCLDHGLEDPSTRELSGKDVQGNIFVSFDEIETQNEKLLSLVVQDDGAGIDPAKIRERFMKLNPDDDISKISDKEIVYKIFDPFFSTRDEVSALSGRGVGMSAIKEVVDRLGGQIEIESQIHKGSTFSFLIPLS